MRYLPRYASVGCAANSRSHSPKTYIVAIFKRDTFALSVFSKRLQLSALCHCRPLNSSHLRFFPCFYGSLSEDQKGSTRSWDRTQVDSTMRYCDSATFVKEFAAMSIPIWDSRMHEIPMPIHSEMVSIHVNFSNFTIFNVLHVLWLAPSIWTRDIVKQSRAGFLPKPFRIRNSWDYLRIFQHLWVGKSQIQKLSQFSNITPSMLHFILWLLGHLYIQ